MDITNESPQSLLAKAIENMDMQLARMLIVDNDIQTKGVSEKHMLIFIRNAALLNDRILLRQLFINDDALGGKVLLRVLDNIEVATTLVLAGAQLNIRDPNSSATLLHLVLASDHPGKFELADLMFDRGAVCSFGSDTHSILKCAIRAGAPDDLLRKFVRDSAAGNFSAHAIAIAESDESQHLMPLLVTVSTADEETRRSRARKAIMYLLSSRSCSTEVVKTLLEYDMAVDAVDWTGSTALFWAIQKANPEVVELYLKRGADPNRTIQQRFLPLWIASSVEDSSLAILLMRYGADVHIRSTNGQCPIHGACKGHSMSNVLLLIRLGVDINVVDRRGITPLSLLAEKHSQNENALYAFVIRQLALAAFRGTEINTRDMRKIQSSVNAQDLFDSSFQELQRMQGLEETEEIPYFTFLTSSVERTSVFTRRDDFTGPFEDEKRLRQLFPCYFCDLKNAYVFAKKREGLLVAKEQFLDEIFLEMYQTSLPSLVINKIANYLCYDQLKNFVLDFHSSTFSSMIWK